MSEISVDELTRLAFFYAEINRREFAQAHPDSEEGARAAELAQRMQTYLTFRWGEDQTEAPPMREPVTIPVRAVLRLTGMSTPAQVAHAEQHSKFPKRIVLARRYNGQPKRVEWRKDEVLAWMKTDEAKVRQVFMLTVPCRRALSSLLTETRPSSDFNPGVVNKLRTSGYVNFLMLPSPYKHAHGKSITHLQITERGQQAVALFSAEKQK